MTDSLVPNGRDRIASILEELIAEATLDKKAVNPLMWDVIYGTFPVTTPQGTIAQTGYAILLLARAIGSGGGAILGAQRHVAQIHILNNLLPTRTEVKQGYHLCLEGLRQSMELDARRQDN